LSRYNDPSYILNLPYDYGMEMILKAHDKDVERTAWELWLTMENKQDNPFGEFLQRFKEPKAVNVDTRTDEEIIQDAEHILTLTKRSE
jgi:hypothetical protein